MRCAGRFVWRRLLEQRTRRAGKPSVDGQSREVAGEHVGTCESIGRRQSKMPGGLFHRAFYLSARHPLGHGRMP